MSDIDVAATTTTATFPTCEATIKRRQRRPSTVPPRSGANPNFPSIAKYTAPYDVHPFVEYQTRTYIRAVQFPHLEKWIIPGGAAHGSRHLCAL